jgi:hypothetical protein
VGHFGGVGVVIHDDVRRVPCQSAPFWSVELPVTGVINAIDDACMKIRLIPVLKWCTRAQTRCKRLHHRGARRECVPNTVLNSADNVV